MQSEPIKKSFRKPAVASQYVVDTPEQSVLLQPLPVEARPYSQLELSKDRHNEFAKLNLSKTWITHSRCGHQYYVKMYGQKYKDSITNGTNIDIGNCSVCWKIRRTPRSMSNAAKYYIDTYIRIFDFLQKNNDYLTFDDMQIEHVYNTWLNLEVYDEDASRKK
jgi:hypothetical protein